MKKQFWKQMEVEQLDVRFFQNWQKQTEVNQQMLSRSLAFCQIYASEKSQL